MEETVGKVHGVSYEAVFSSRPAGQVTLCLNRVPSYSNKF